MPSWPQPIQHAWKRNRLPYVLQPADPGHYALDAHAEAAVGDVAVASQVEVPLEVLAREVLLLDMLQEQGVIGQAFAAADNLAVPFRRQHVHAQGQLGMLR